jgi:hypothetical protein
MNDIVIRTTENLTAFSRSSDADQLVYRGQPSCDWGLVPSIYRGVEADIVDEIFDELVQMERDIYREFKNKSARFIGNRAFSAWDVLVSAQHYGSPTRLLDWTTKLLGAAYFAAAGLPDNDGVIWVARAGSVPIPPELKLGRLHLNRCLRVEQIQRYVSDSSLPFMMPVSMTTNTIFHEGGTAEDTCVAFDQSGIPGCTGILVFLDAPFTNPRIGAQGGLFSVYVSRDAEIVVDHASYLHAIAAKTGTEILRRLIIPAESKREMIRDLERLGVDAFAMFPDVEGLSAYLRGWHDDKIRSIAAAARRQSLV